MRWLTRSIFLVLAVFAGLAAFNGRYDAWYDISCCICALLFVISAVLLDKSK